MSSKFVTLGLFTVLLLVGAGCGSGQESSVNEGVDLQVNGVPSPDADIGGGTESSEPLALGSVTSVEDTECTDAPCKEVRVACPDIPDVSANLRITGEGTAGTIILSTGGNGKSLFSHGGEFKVHDGEYVIIDFMDALTDDGFKLVEVAWGQDGIWGLPSDGSVTAGAQTLACRYATVATWIHDNLYTGGMFGAQGNSGGSAQNAFSLAHYGLEELFDVVNLGGGPPPCPIAVGGKPNYDGQKPCLGKNPSEELGSIFFRNPDVDYPNTIVNFFVGEDEPNPDIKQSATRLHKMITSESSMTRVPNTAHPVFLTSEGAAAQLASFREAAARFAGE